MSVASTEYVEQTTYTAPVAKMQLTTSFRPVDMWRFQIYLRQYLNVGRGAPVAILTTGNGRKRIIISVTRSDTTSALEKSSGLRQYDFASCTVLQAAEMWIPHANIFPKKKAIVHTTVTTMATMMTQSNIVPFEATKIRR